MKTIRTIFLLNLALFSSLSLAHAGHDHSNPLAVFMHLLWLIPMFAAVGITYYLWLPKSSRTNRE